MASGDMERVQVQDGTELKEIAFACVNMLGHMIPLVSWQAVKYMTSCTHLHHILLHVS